MKLLKDQLSTEERSELINNMLKARYGQQDLENHLDSVFDKHHGCPPNEDEYNDEP